MCLVGYAGFLRCKRDSKLEDARELLLNSLTAIGLDSKHFFLHSLRSGGASAATSINISDRLIKSHGRWRTDVAKDVYIKDNLNKQLVVSSNLGI